MLVLLYKVTINNIAAQSEEGKKKEGKQTRKKMSNAIQACVYTVYK